MTNHVYTLNWRWCVKYKMTAHQLYWEFLHIISLNRHQWWLSSPVSFDQALQSSPPLGPLWLLWAQAFVGVWPLQIVKKKKEERIIEGEHRLGRHACMCVRWECWLASADATQASAVSSHQLIPLPRSPCDPEVLSSLLWPGTFSMDGEAWTEAPVRLPASATSSLWHNTK